MKTVFTLCLPCSLPSQKPPVSPLILPPQIQDLFFSNCVCVSYWVAFWDMCLGLTTGDWIPYPGDWSMTKTVSLFLSIFWSPVPLHLGVGSWEIPSIWVGMSHWKAGHTTSASSSAVSWAFRCRGWQYRCLKCSWAPTDTYYSIWIGRGSHSNLPPLQKQSFLDERVRATCTCVFDWGVEIFNI